ncbi:MAG: hypothetical protein Q8O56_10905 [Solirubrobacteraceae bacterium]|nr:hypothetical protein [Solirubrobacteraceae bacterium]
MSCLRRPLVLLVVLLCSGGLAACGVHHDKSAPIQHIESEGFYLSLGDLKYQVQISRQLNPDDIQDRAFLNGVNPSERELGENEVWFGVFIQVENEADRPLRPSGEIEITDTQDEVFAPLALTEANAFAYRSTEAIPPGEILPLPDTPAYDTAIRGSLLLFKLTLESLDNRPLELKIESSTTRQTGIIDLDV